MTTRPQGSGPCLVVTVGRNAEGYGRVWVDGNTRYAHRLALETKLGRPIRPGYCALHTCDNPPCVNADHLYEGTDADNRRDCVARGRSRSAESLTPTQIEALRSGSMRDALALGDRLHVSYRTVYRVRSAEQGYVRRAIA